MGVGRSHVPEREGRERTPERVILASDFSCPDTEEEPWP